ncbi:glycosyltransferase [Brevibacterium album]|uniref:glycosyltransferase n=1 Tax=Brevibacterium album TaxID=417948 RepID=UPI00040EFA2E|nr:glycosyltransferase family 2 protein [Brevibacterium album]
MRAGGVQCARETAGEAGALRADYLLPLRWEQDGAHGQALAELVGYLADLPPEVEVTVVDGSAPEVRELHAAALPPGVRHLSAEAVPGANGKVSGVLSALPHLTHPAVVIADDDVRYSAEALREVLRRLERADLVVPQNVFATGDGSPLPWHAGWDTARSCLNRAFGTDFPGTLALRRSVLAGGYDPAVLFENLELMRTVRARGGLTEHAPEVYVERRPPSTRKFAGQRVRQAYDSRAQPLRCAVELMLLPAVLAGLRRPSLLVAGAAAAVLLAEAGRRRAGGGTVIPASTALWAPLWLLERAACAWIALAAGLRGGIRYGGTRLPTAAHSLGTLRRRERERAGTGADESTRERREAWR